MPYIALYREWRPTRFEEIVEQEHVVKTLRHSVSSGRIAHAYLFCGTRGTGKTTMAQILSRAVNCLDPHDGEPCNKCEICLEILSGSSVDVLEIDAASNNSVDNVRAIRDEVIYAPARARRKVYIIDEVHMLSTGAFNALLKTLEEPPEHVIFILATTEPHKLPATILSRCQRFDFRRISLDGIVKQLCRIASSCGITLDTDAAKLIARLSDGAMRDAISLLDQCISLGVKRIGYDNVLSVAGIVNDSFIAEFTENMLKKNIPAVLDNINSLVMDGRDIAHFTSDLVLNLRNLLICKSAGEKCDHLIDAPQDVLKTLKEQSGLITQDEIIRYIKELSALAYNLKWASNQRVMLEVTVIKLCGSESYIDASISDRLAALEKRMDMAAQTAGMPASTGTMALVKDTTPLADNIATRGNDTVTPGSSTTIRTDDIPASTNAMAPGAYVPEYSPETPPSADDAPVSGTDAAPSAVPSQPGSAEARDFKKWPEIMEYLKSRGRMAIYLYLLNVEAKELDDHTIGLFTADKNIRSNISRLEHLKLIEEAASIATGREMKIICLDESFFSKQSSKTKPPENSDLINKAKSIAEIAGLPLEIIDE
ncbi:MAG: DNA polymerase III subunit gamma/tau [Bacillota bacterium]